MNSEILSMGPKERDWTIDLSGLVKLCPEEELRRFYLYILTSVCCKRYELIKRRMLEKKKRMVPYQRRMKAL